MGKPMEGWLVCGDMGDIVSFHPECAEDANNIPVVVIPAADFEALVREYFAASLVASRSERPARAFLRERNLEVEA